MYYSELTTKAMKLAYEKHHGQVDKAGIPYIFHLCDVANSACEVDASMELIPYDSRDKAKEALTCVGLLHDILEDTDTNEADLRAEFPDYIVDAVCAMTHAKNEPYKEYLLRAKQNRLAYVVKTADILANNSSNRLSLAAISPEDATRLRDKYTKAIDILFPFPEGAE